MEQNRVDILCITEHFVKEQNVDNIFLHGYTIGIFARARYIHGGSMILIRDDIKFIEIEEIKHLSVEKDIKLASIKRKNENLVIISVYRSPNGDSKKFLNIIGEALSLVNNG